MSQNKYLDLFAKLTRDERMKAVILLMKKLNSFEEIDMVLQLLDLQLRNTASHSSIHNVEVHKLTPDKVETVNKSHWLHVIQAVRPKSTKRTKSSSSSPKNKKSRKSPALYCYCRQPSSKDLLGCDFCPEWYHPKCLNISAAETRKLVKDTWKCPECVKKLSPCW